MTTVFFQIIVAVTVASLVMGLWNLLRMFMDQGEQRKINTRLKRTIEDQVQSDLTKSLRRRTGLDEVQGMLGRFEIIHNVNKTLLQSAPNVTLKKFLWIVAASAVGLMLMVFLIFTGIDTKLCNQAQPVELGKASDSPHSSLFFASLAQNYR